MGEEAELRQPQLPPGDMKVMGGGGVNWGEVIKGGLIRGGERTRAEATMASPPPSWDMKVVGRGN